MAKVLDLETYKAGVGTSTKPWWKDTDESPKELWDKVYGENYLNWWHPDSKSGEGTVKEADRRIKVINSILKDYEIETDTLIIELPHNSNLEMLYKIIISHGCITNNKTRSTC